MNEFLKHNKALKTLISEVAEVAAYLWQRGWAERNAGNISVNITDLIQPENHELTSFPVIGLPEAYPKLAGSYFFVTATGKRMRDLAHKPMKNALIIRLNADANGYHIISRKKDDSELKPTSELATHLGVHQMIALRGSSEKVVMHAHVTELIVLTQAKEFCSREVLNNVVWGMHPETIMFIPKGVGFVPFLLPGSMDIARETIKALKDHDHVLWEKHGVFAIGTNLPDTFDILDILAKTARIFLMARAADIIPDGFSELQLDELKKLGMYF